MHKKLKVIKYTLLGLIIFFSVVLISYYLFPMKISFSNNIFNYNAKIINLKYTDKVDVDDLINKLQFFPKLKKIILPDLTVTYEERKKINEKYPNVEIEGITLIEIDNNFYAENSVEIDLRKRNIDDTILERLPLFKNLKSVNLLNNNIDIELLKQMLEKFDKINFLYTVNIEGRKIYSNIECLNLSKMQIKNKDKFKEKLKLLPNLKSLDMADTNFTNEELGQMREEFPNIEINWMLYLGVWHFRTDAISFSVLITNFSYNPIRSEDLEIFKYCTKMQALDLGHQIITDVSAIPKYLPELRILILADNKISDITPLKKLKHLHYLELFLNKITDISPLSECKELVDLNLCYNPNLSDLSPIMGLKNLERIWLVNTKITSQTKKQLEETFPKATISYYGVGSTDGGWRRHERYYEMIKMYKTPGYLSKSFTKYDNIA